MPTEFEDETAAPAPRGLRTLDEALRFALELHDKGATPDEAVDATLAVARARRRSDG